MTDNRKLLEELQTLKNEIHSLKVDNDFLQRQNNALKMRCSKYSLEIKDLTSEIQDLRFTHNYLTSEEAGRQFARELLGKPMTPEEVVIENDCGKYSDYPEMILAMCELSGLKAYNVVDDDGRLQYFTFEVVE